MKVIVFDQWDKLVAKFKGIATAAMNERTQYDIVRVEPKGGRVQLADRSMNNLAVFRRGDRNRHAGHRAWQGA